MNDRCGAGVIQEQKAAKLLALMQEWTNANLASPTQASYTTINLKQKNPPISFTTPGTADKTITLHSYSLEIPEDALLTQLRTTLSFQNHIRGGATIKIGDNTPFPLDLASSGLSTEARFAGTVLKKGEEIKIITTKPLITDKQESLSKPSQITLTTVPLNSPIAKAFEENRRTENFNEYVDQSLKAYQNAHLKTASLK